MTYNYSIRLFPSMIKVEQPNCLCHRHQSLFIILSTTSRTFGNNSMCCVILFPFKENPAPSVAPTLHIMQLHSPVTIIACLITSDISMVKYFFILWITQKSQFCQSVPNFIAFDYSEQLPYGSKYSWDNIFINFVNILHITTILDMKIFFTCY